MKVTREMNPVPTNYLKKLVNTDDIWEVRVDVGRDTFRLLGFFDGRELIILTNSFQKKTQKTPRKEILINILKKERSRVQNSQRILTVVMSNSKLESC